MFVSSSALTKNFMMTVGVPAKGARVLQLCVPMASHFVHSYKIKLAGLLFMRYFYPAYNWHCAVVLAIICLKYATRR